MKVSFENFFRIIKKYQWKSLFFVYLKQILLIILIPAVILFSVTFFYRIDMMKQEFSTLIQTSLDKTSVLFNNMTQSIDSTYNFIYSSSYSKSFFHTDLDNKKGYELSNISQKIVDSFQPFLNVYSYISSIYVYNVKSNYVVSNIGQGKLEDFIDKSWYEIYAKTGNPHFIYPSEFMYGDENIRYLSFSYPVKYSTDLDGIIVINLDIKELDRLFASMPDEEFFILSEDKFIYSTDSELTGKAITDCEDISEFYSASNDKAISKTKLDTAWASVKDTNYNLTLISKLHSEDFAKSFQSMLVFYVLIFIVILLLSVAYSMYNAFKFYYYIADIIIALPDFGVINDIDSKETNNELVSIRNNLIAMINKTENIEKNLAEKMNSLKTAQTFALQSQINPHFIFNTLNLINLTIIDSYGMNHKSIKLISLLSEILSGIYSSNNYLVSVEEELQYAKKFIEIEQIKTDNSFSVKWDIDSRVYDKKTLKMILQPIIENAIEHGIKPRFDKEGKLTIKAYCENGKTIFAVSDNGVGISKNKLDDLMEKIENPDISDCKHLGVKNVNHRINLLYGKEYNIRINSSPSGTDIIITQPEEKYML